MRRLTYTNKRPTEPGRYRYRFTGTKTYSLFAFVYMEMETLYGVFVSEDGEKLGIMPIEATHHTGEWARIGGIL